MKDSIFLVFAMIIHQLTALAGASGNFKKFDQEFALTNRPSSYFYGKSTLCSLLEKFSF